MRVHCSCIFSGFQIDHQLFRVDVWEENIIARTLPSQATLSHPSWPHWKPENGLKPASFVGLSGLVALEAKCQDSQTCASLGRQTASSTPV